MNKPIKNILCYSHYDFDNIMRDNGWTNKLPEGVSAISICSPNEGDLAEHWFKYDYNIIGENHNPRVFNLDIDDSSPFWFENHESECYDNALDLYLDNQIKRSNLYFNHLYISGENKQWVNLLHVLDYEEAFKLASWIEWRLKYDDTIYIHCAVGASRSQGVVRYIVDTYRYDYDIRLNPNNPNNTYNPHVLMMLKRAYMNSDFYSCITRDDENDKSFYAVPTKEHFIEVLKNVYLKHGLYEIIEIGKTSFSMSGGGIMFNMNMIGNECYVEIGFDIAHFTKD